MLPYSESSQAVIRPKLEREPFENIVTPASALTPAEATKSSARTLGRAILEHGRKKVRLEIVHSNIPRGISTYYEKTHFGQFS
jgi:hypothetical protein